MNMETATDRRDPPRKKLEPPKGYRFDPFADVRMGKSLFQMAPKDWLVRKDTDQ